MKLFILISLLVTLCVAQRYPPNNILQQATQAVKNAKASVQSIMSDMDRTKRMLVMNTNSEISNIYSQNFQAITDVQNTRLKYIKEKLEEANASGKDATACLNTVTNNMRAAASTGYNDVSRCKDEANQQFQAQLQAFDTAKATGQKIINDLDRIALDCYTSDIFQMANCMTVKVGLANMNIREYKQTVARIESQAQANKRNIILSQQSCSNGAVSKVRSASSDAIYQAADCLKN